MITILSLLMNGSRDTSALILAELAAQDEHVEAYLLSRNYGHQIGALTVALIMPTVMRLLRWMAICSIRLS